MQLVDNIVDVLEQRRQDAEVIFNVIFCKVTAHCSFLRSSCSDAAAQQSWMAKELGELRSHRSRSLLQASHLHTIHRRGYESALNLLTDRCPKNVIPRFIDASISNDLTEALHLYRSDLGPGSVIERKFER